MTNCPLSSSYPNAFQSRALRDVTKSKLGEDPLSESWPMSFMQSASFKSMTSNSTQPLITSTTEDENDDENRASAGNDLSSLAWLQKECLLDIPPLDEEDVRPLKTEEVVSNHADTTEKIFVPRKSSISNSILPPSSTIDLGPVRRPGKPAYSYTHLIFMAIESSPHKCRTVNQIYNWCETHFPYFRSAGPGWKNSLRHNLSINKCFKRIPRDGRLRDRDNDDDNDCQSTEPLGPGRGAYWTVEPGERQQLLVAVKRNPWTYYAGLATIPELVASLPPPHPHGYPIIPVSICPPLPPGNHQQLQHSSSEDPITSSGAASSLEDDQEEGGSDGEERERIREKRESAKYASLLRHLTLHSLTSSSSSTVKKDRKGEHHHRHLHSSLSGHRHQQHRRHHRSYTRSPADSSVKDLESSASSPHEDLLNGRLNASDIQGVLDLMSFQSRRPHLHPSKTNVSDKAGITNSLSPDQDQQPQGGQRKDDATVTSTDQHTDRRFSKCNVCERRRKRRRRRQQQQATATDATATTMVTGVSGDKDLELGQRRRNTACFITPAPSLDHEYAKFQAQMHPPTNFSDDEEEEEQMEMNEEQVEQNGGDDESDDAGEEEKRCGEEEDEVSTESRDSETEGMRPFPVVSKSATRKRSRVVRNRRIPNKKLVIRLKNHRSLRRINRDSNCKSAPLTLFPSINPTESLDQEASVPPVVTPGNKTIQDSAADGDGEVDIQATVSTTTSIDTSEIVSSTDVLADDDVQPQQRQNRRGGRRRNFASFRQATALQTLQEMTVVK